MALPKVTGDNPEIAILTKDIWTKVAQGVNAAKIHNNYGANTVVWMTYVKTDDPVPADLDVPKWKMPSDFIQFEDTATTRDIYLYPVGSDSKITVEA